jgi:rhodanese-related sulfurtransferase
VATALAGVVRANLAAFIFFDAIGAALWAALAIGLGRLFHNAIGDLLDALEQFGRWGLILLALALGAWLAGKWWQRWRFYRELRMARISVPELSELMQSGERPMILDVRTPGSQARIGRIPGSITVDGTAPLSIHLEHPRDGEVIVYCACPNEASAARVAKQLMAQGFKHVRPLAGGIDAWISAGLQIDLG